MAKHELLPTRSFSSSDSDSDFNDDSDVEDVSPDASDAVTNHINGWTTGAQANLNASRFVIDEEPHNPFQTKRRSETSANLVQEIEATMNDADFENDRNGLSNTGSKTNRKVFNSSVIGCAKRQFLPTRRLSGAPANKRNDEKRRKSATHVVKPNNVDEVASQYMFSKRSSVTDYGKLIEDADEVLESSTSKKNIFGFDKDPNGFSPRVSDISAATEKSPTALKFKSWWKNTDDEGINNGDANMNLQRFSSNKSLTESERFATLGNSPMMYADTTKKDRRLALIFITGVTLLGVIITIIFATTSPWDKKGERGHDTADNNPEIDGNGSNFTLIDSENSDASDNGGEQHANNSFPNNDPSLSRDEIFMIVQKVTNSKELKENGTPQEKASKWLAEIDPLVTSPDFRLADNRVVQRYILATFYYALGGNTNKWAEKDAWLSGKHECDWSGINCNASENLEPGSVGSGSDNKLDDAITAIVLNGNGLVGSLPDEIGYLSNLESLWLSDNNISGTIPETIIQITTLQQLFLTNNKLEGKIPEDIGAFVNMEGLDLSNNRLTGKIPNDIGNMESLDDLRLSKNKLSGEFPIEILEVTNLRTLLLDHNEIEGEIPRLIGQLKNLKILRLSENELSGPIPDEIGQLTTLHELHLDGNVLTGSIPLALQNLIDLRQLFLTDNALSSIIPSEIGKLKNLSILRLDGNGLENSIPSTLGSLTNLREAHMEDNHLSGDMPDGICKLNLDILSVDCDKVKCICCSSC